MATEKTNTVEKAAEPAKTAKDLVVEAHANRVKTVEAEAVAAAEAEEKAAKAAAKKAKAQEKAAKAAAKKAKAQEKAVVEKKPVEKVNHGQPVRAVRRRTAKRAERVKRKRQTEE